MILATNIAESSITIDGVQYVVDCGFVKVRGYQAATGMECLLVVPTSQQQAWQRAGRAGRSSAGKCYRLYTEDAFGELPKHAVRSGALRVHHSGPPAPRAAPVREASP